MNQPWAIYDLNTSVVLSRGSGPPGFAALQKLNPGEALVLRSATPGKDMVQKVAGVLSVVANPNYTPPAVTIVPNTVQSPDGTAWTLGTTNGGAVTATKV